MDSRLIKQLSYVAFSAGIASVVGSGILYALGKNDRSPIKQNNGLFVGLWAPTFFAIAEMLDRLSIEDDRYLGMDIDHPNKLAELGRKMVLQR